MVPFSPFGDCWLLMARQHQAGMSWQSKLVTFATPEGSAPGALPWGVPKMTSFDCQLIPAWFWRAIINQQSPNGEKGTIP